MTSLKSLEVTVMKLLSSLFVWIFEFPIKLLGLPQFIKERKALWGTYQVGEWVRLKKIRENARVIMIENEQGMHELKKPTFIPTTAAYLWFEEYEPFEIIEVHTSKIFDDVCSHLRFHNLRMDHPCYLTIRTKKVTLGKNIIEWAPGQFVEKVPPPSYASEPR